MVLEYLIMLSQEKRVVHIVVTACQTRAIPCINAPVSYTAVPTWKAVNDGMSLPRSARIYYPPGGLCSFSSIVIYGAGIIPGLFLFMV